MTRDSQGYTTHGDCDLIARGTTGIGQFGNGYSRHLRDLDPYYEGVDAGRLPISRGPFLTGADCVRRDSIQHLMRDFVLDVAGFDYPQGADFAREREAVEPLVADGLVE